MKVMESVSVIIKWAGKEYPMEDLDPNLTVQDLKELIRDKTNVLPSRQKLLNLKFKGQVRFTSAKIIMEILIL